jgi:hypothetical protein
MTDFDLASVQCTREGWRISDCSGATNGDQFRLEREDETAIFMDDDSAWQFVFARARAGSAYHAASLEFLKINQPNEYYLILSAQEGVS